MPGVVAFTGSRILTPVYKNKIWGVMSGFYQDYDRQHSIIVTGGCIGVDEEVARLASLIASWTVHTVLPFDKTRADPDAVNKCTTFELMSEGTTYQDRNKRLVDMATELVAFPRYSEDHPKSKRSGTWQTIRLAQKKGIKVTIYILEDNEEGLANEGK